MHSLSQMPFVDLEAARRSKSLENLLSTGPYASAEMYMTKDRALGDAKSQLCEEGVVCDCSPLFPLTKASP